MIPAPFKIPIFGGTLEEIMEFQTQKQAENFEVPKVLIFLCSSIIDLGGPKEEDLFQHPAPPSDIVSLKLSIETGDYRNCFSDPHVPASLLKLWFRELSVPIILPEFYDIAIEHAQTGDAALCCELVEKDLPVLNRKVIYYIIKILRKIQHLSNGTLQLSKLSMIFAPNLFRCPSNDPGVVLASSKLQQIFIEHLLSHLNCT